MLAVAVGSDKLGFPASAFQLSKEPLWLKLRVGLVQLGGESRNRGRDAAADESRVAADVQPHRRPPGDEEGASGLDGREEVRKSQGWR